MKTVAINPAVCFANGKRMIATQLNVTSVQDNLFDHVIFKYVLLDASNQWAGESTFALEGLEQYLQWDTSAHGAFGIVAAGIGLTLETPAVGGKVEFIEVI